MQRETLGSPTSTALGLKGFWSELAKVLLWHKQADK